ncbi:MAG: OmpA family protein [Reichenbachiella sp.]|uniref:OmpA family protein n=1 Tax=Reichenbachiella sp. TaxID=2184521 RepID=UPI003297F6E8
MRKFIVLIIAIQCYLPLHGQTISSSVLKKADQEFEEFSYANAVTYYKLALKRGENKKYITGQIALSFRNLNLPDSAEVWFKKAVADDPVPSEFYFYLAECLLSNEKYSEAKYWYSEYTSLVGSSSRSLEKLTALENMGQFFTDIDQIKLDTVSQNSSGLDFSPAYFKDGLMFISSRPRSPWVNLEFNWDESNFLDYYYMSQSDEPATFYEDGLNSKFHEGPLVFYNDDQSVIFTRNNLDNKKLRKDDKGVTNLKLFFAEWDESSGHWINEKPFIHNSESFSTSSPTINEDGTVLVFSSDRPGGFGASDLYISIKEPQGWSEPRNLGPDVNSEGRDGFPYLYDGQLYFSSDGHGGLGGLDLYRIRLNGVETSGKAVNLGVPFNSSKDDFGLIRQESNGYFSSNRVKGKRDDIYKFEYEKLSFGWVIGEVYDLNSNMPLDGSDVFFQDEDGAYKYTRTDKNGAFKIAIPMNTAWTITAGKNTFDLVESVSLLMPDRDSVYLQRVYLHQKIEPAQVADSVDIPTEVASIVDERIRPYDETSHFVDEFSEGDSVKFENVYFDLASYEIRENEKPSLNKLVNFMIEHVDVEIELSSHTDARSSAEYNKVLSQNRSKSVANYLIKMGGDPHRLKLSAYGESDLVNDCGNDVPCSEEQHQLNRRTSIYVVKAK